jgi:hypothetical protein
MREKITALLLNPRTLLVVFMLAAVGAAVQMILLGTHPFIMPKAGTYPMDIMNKPQYMNMFLGHQMTEYNNYLIFKYSWYHLLEGTNLYGIYPERHWDFYKYSPTFALLMSTMAYLPDVVGLSIFNLLNALAVFFCYTHVAVQDTYTMPAALVCGYGAAHLPAKHTKQRHDVRTDDSCLWLYAAWQAPLGYPMAGTFCLHKGLWRYRLLPVSVLSRQAPVYTVCDNVDGALCGIAAAGNTAAHATVAIWQLGRADDSRCRSSYRHVGCGLAQHLVWAW